MFRFNRVACVCLVCLLVTFAFGKPLKVKAFGAVGDGITENPDADGVAILNFESGNNTTHVHLRMTDLLANTDYIAVVTITHPSGFSFDPANVQFTTNSAGNGGGQARPATDITFDGTACATVNVYRDLNGDLVLEDSEKRASGTNCS